MARIKGILFDLGGTLVDFGPVNTMAMFAEGARQAYSYLQELGQPLPSLRRFRRHQLWAVRWHYMKGHLTRREFNSLDVLGRLSRKMGQTLTADEMEELAWLWYEPLSRCATIEAGLPELLAGFRADGLRLGVVSNTFIPAHVLDRHLAQLGLLGYFAVRIYSCEVVYRKPHPQIFRVALERLGIAAREAVFVGDSLAADIAGAARVGMVTVLKDSRGRRKGSGPRPTYRVKSLRQLRGVLGERIGPSRP